MRVVWNIFKKLVLLVFVSFVLLNAIAIVVLNSRQVQGLVVDYINRDMLAEYDLKVRLGFLSVNFLTAVINLEEVEVLDLATTKAPGDLSLPAASPLRLARIKVNVAPVASYLARRPVVNSVTLSGLDIKLKYASDGSLELPQFFKRLQSNEIFNFKREYQAARKLLPAAFEVENSTFELGDPLSNRYQKLFVKSLSVKNPERTDARAPLNMVLELGESEARFPILDAPLTWTSIVANVQIAETGRIDLIRLEADSQAFKGSIGGEFIVAEMLEDSTYRARFVATLQNSAMLKTVGLKGKGAVTLAGVVSQSGKGLLSHLPQANGSMSWKDAQIEAFALHAGQGQWELKNASLRLKKIQLTTPLGASLEAEGLVEFKPILEFSAKAAVDGLKFTELMTSLDVPVDFINFGISASEVSVSGKVNTSDTDQFELAINGKVHTRALIVPVLDSPKRTPLPDCAVDLVLFVDMKRLALDGTQASCSADASDTVVVRQGEVIFEGAQTKFNFDAENFDLKALEYFLLFPTEGSANLKATLTASAKLPVVFSSAVEGRDVLLYGVRYATLDGRVGVNADEANGADLTGVLANPEGSEQAIVKLKRFFVRFGSLESAFVGTASGSLQAVRAGFADLLPPAFPEVIGQLQQLDVDLAGPIDEPTKWSLRAAANVSNVKAKGLVADRVQARMECVKGLCTQSKAVAFALREARSSSSSNSSDKEKVEREAPGTQSDSLVALEIASLSTAFVKAALEVRNLPMSVLRAVNVDAGGTLTGRLDLNGPWKTWEASLGANFDALSISSQTIGPVSLQAISHNGGDVNAVLTARYQQVQARLRVPHDLKGPSSLYVRTQGFDAGFLMAAEKRTQSNFFSQIDGEVSADGPGPLSEAAGGLEPWYDVWRVKGTLSKLNLQFKQITFALKQKTPFVIKNGKIDVEELAVITNKGEIKAGGTFNLANSEIAAEVNANISLDILQDFSNRFGPSVGEITTKLAVSGSLPHLGLSGGADIKGTSVVLKDYSPALTSVRGRLLFEDDNLEIQSLHADKGDGQIDVVGSVNWSRMVSDEQAEPTLALHMEAKGAQIRFPVPVLEAFDTALDGTLELSGDSQPYTLGGQVRVLRARAYRDITCQDIFKESPERRERDLKLNAKPFANLNLSLDAEESIVVQTGCLKGKMSAGLRITGNTDNPVVAGTFNVAAATVSFLKSKFEVTKAELMFDNPVRLDPRVEAQLVSKIDNYKVFVSIDGTLSRPHTNVWSDPPSTPEGETLTRPDLFRMLASGQPPARGFRQNTGQALASQVAGYVYGSTAIDESLSQAFSRITGGFIDSVELQPLIENGQTKWKARVSRQLGERLNLGLDIDQGNNQSLTGTVLLNDSVNLLGGFDRRTNEGTTYNELSGGLRFQFGSR